MITMTCKTI